MGSETMAPATSKPSLSKRQRRLQGPNPSNTWQQQPRIKSASARARAYISYAGLADNADINKSTKDGKSTKGTETTKSSKTLDPTLDLHSPEVKFGRMLGGTDQRSRHQAVKMLREYLRARADIGTGSGISELDLMKLWKGLWYTLYMADKVPVQDKLSQILAELMWCLAGTQEDDEYAGQLYLQMDEKSEDFDPDVMDEEEIDEEMLEEINSDDDEYKILSVERVESEDEESADEESGEDETHEDEKHCRGAHLVSLYIATFLRTVRREWGNVDKHRVDKFYTAVRLMLSEAYKYMAKRYWNMGIVRLFNDVLYEEALSQTPNGLRYHLIDICVEELAKVNKDATVPLTEATILDCLEPFFAMAQRVDDKNVQKRVVNSVLLKFLNEYSFVSDVAIREEDPGEEEDTAKLLIFRQVHVGTVAKFIFEIASDADTDERYRKGLYELHKTFVRQIRAAGRDVDPEDAKEEEGDEVFCGVSEEQVEQADASDDIPAATSKKEKKKKKKKHKEPKVDSEAGESVPETPSQKDESLQTTKSSKKKKRKSPHKEASESAAETLVAKENGESAKEADSEPSAKASKKKKRKKQIKEPDTVDKEPNTSEPSEVTPAPKKKKKKQKSRSMVDSDGVGNEDNNETNTTPNSSDGEGQGMMSASKRVSFGAMNQSKSHKASMKALKTLTPKVWSTVNRTPDRSILLKKAEAEAKAKEKKASRKKKGKRNS